MKLLMMKKWKALSKWYRIPIVFFIIIFFAEIVLRIFVGLGDLPIYREDSSYEYFYVANQNVWRYGNNIITNEYGMRSGSINKKKKVTILEFGDSVLNGGAHVDQNKLSTVLQENFLNNELNNEVQILNISAQSWGVGNAFAFLKKHGNFNAKIFVMVFSSHDLFDNMHFKKVVGNELNWPDSKPWLAITDLINRYLIPKFKSKILGIKEYSYLDDFDDTQVNPSWIGFFNYCKENDIKLLVYLHATQKELNQNSYNQNGEKIIKLCQDNQIELIEDFKLLKSHKEAFLDDIHLNEIGHEIMAKELSPILLKHIEAIYNFE